MSAIHINSQTFETYLESRETVLVDFWAPWWGYCRRIAAAYDKVAEQYGNKVKVVKINIDEESALSDREGIEVIPTLALYRDGKRLDAIVAPQSKAEIDAFLGKYL